MMEYGVQMLVKVGNDLVWEPCPIEHSDMAYRSTTEDVEEAKWVFKKLKHYHVNERLRIVFREVGDWCECNLSAERQDDRHDRHDKHKGKENEK